MGYVEAALLIISLASLAYGAYLAKSAAKKQKSVDDQITTLTNRGDYVPVVIGTRRIGYLFGWAGNRQSEGGSSGGKGAGDAPEGITWYEGGWHILCAGPAKAIHAMYSNNRRIGGVLGTITREASPSGTTFTIPAGTFTIYWGEDDQPVDTWLSSKLGYSSQHPGLCYIVWRRCKLGSSPTWPQMEYVIEADCPALSLNDSEYEVEDSGFRGVNLGHALLQVLCAPFPHGNGLRASEVDDATLEALGVLMEDEKIGVNMVIEGGESADNIVGSFLQDAGVLMPQVQHRLAFLANRFTEDEAPIFGNDIITPPEFERDINHGEEDVTRTIFTFKNQDKWAFRDADIPYDDDGEVSEINKVVNGSAQIETVTNPIMANKIAQRRWQETSNVASFKVRAVRGAMRMSAGQFFDHEEFGRLRVISVLPNAETPEAELDVIPDIYAVPSIPDMAEGGGGAVEVLEPADDVGLTWFELPEELQTGTLTQIVVLRTRAHNQMEGATVYASADSSSYQPLGRQDNAAAGGLIETAIASGDASPIVTGPIFEDENGDAANIADYTGDTVSWEAGVQIAVINDEVFFLESVSVLAETAWTPSTSYSVGDYVIPTGSTGLRYRCVGAGLSLPTEPTWPTVKGEQMTEDGVGVPTWEARYFRYQMNNLIRAQYGSVAADHAIGDRVFIIEQSRLTPFSSPLLAPSANVCVKTYPFSREGIATTSLEVCKDMSA